MANGDQALAAEPGFHGHPPRSGGWEVTALRRLFGHYSELVEQQPENGVALAPGQGEFFQVHNSLVLSVKSS
ncbi:MAG: hypothetical protein KJ070_23755, partial [Verrucomicrobia bacterium]|nr:hypothetical protein [Verrucomicrobiota bacterium]